MGSVTSTACVSPPFKDVQGKQNAARFFPTRLGFRVSTFKASSHDGVITSQKKISRKVAKKSGFDTTLALRKGPVKCQTGGGFHHLGHGFLSEAWPATFQHTHQNKKLQHVVMDLRSDSLPRGLTFLFAFGDGFRSNGVSEIAFLWPFPSFQTLEACALGRPYL